MPLLHRCYSWRTNHSRFPVLFLHSSSLFRSNGVVARYLCPPFSLSPSSPLCLYHSFSLSRLFFLSFSPTVASSHSCSRTFGGCGGSATASPPPLPLFPTRSVSVGIARISSLLLTLPRASRLLRPDVVDLPGLCTTFCRDGRWATQMNGRGPCLTRTWTSPSSSSSSSSVSSLLEGRSSSPSLFTSCFRRP